MSKSRKKNKASASAASGVNTLGIDIEIEPASVPYEPASVSAPAEAAADAPDGFELPDEELELYDEAQPLAEKIINYATLALSMLLLGGSLVFWWVIGSHLIADPSALADSGQMSAILLTCAIFPVLVTAAQILLRRPLSVERWLICMCISGAASAMAVVIYLMGFRGDDFGFADYFTLLCCTVSGATLPSALCMAVRWLTPIIAGKISAARADESWQDMSEDVRSMTDFDL